MIKKNKNITILLLFIILLNFSCDNNNTEIIINKCYSKIDDKIVYKKTDGSGTILNIKLQGVNPEKFKVIKNLNPENTCVNADVWAGDSMSIYYKSNKLKGANSQNFKVLSQGYSTDNKNIYFRDKNIPNANADKFTVLGDYYATDYETVWFMGRKTTGIKDLANFEIIDGYFAKDSNHIYLIKDTSFIIENNTNIKYFKPAKFENSDDFPELKFYSDSNKVFLFETGIRTPSGHRFIYFDTNPDSFKIYTEKNYFSDGKNIYYGKSLLQNANIQHFKPLGNKYSKDNRNVYYKNHIISNMPASFELIKSSNIDAKDSIYSFYKGNIIIK